ncbi:hypothetical protein F4808DRAFT_460933 [Astrocystis sublimbata]|nr:hypothetical protein F4808DRAFT_460933 [Astrocystis sublimbata]
MLPPGVSADEYFQNHPDGPPPGLVRTYPATPAPYRLYNNTNTAIFSDFAPYLDYKVDENGVPLLIDLTCSICMTSKLRAPGCCMAIDPGDLHNGVEWEDIAVLPCGHYFGDDCVLQWFHVNENFTCPVCRYETVYSCEHIMKPRVYNPEYPRHQSIPVTIPEGGLVPTLCQECYEEEIILQVRELRRLLFPDEIVPGDLQYSDSVEVLRDLSQQFKEKVLSYVDANHHWIRW